MIRTLKSKVPAVIETLTLNRGEACVGQVMRGTVQHRGHKHQDIHARDDDRGVHRPTSLFAPRQDLHGENMFVFGAHGRHVLNGQFTCSSEDGIVVHQFGENMVGEIPFHFFGLSVVHGPLGYVQGDVMSSNLCCVKGSKKRKQTENGKHSDAERKNGWVSGVPHQGARDNDGHHTYRGFQQQTNLL